MTLEVIRAGSGFVGTHAGGSNIQSLKVSEDYFYVLRGIYSTESDEDMKAVLVECNPIILKADLA